MILLFFVVSYVHVFSFVCDICNALKEIGISTRNWVDSARDRD